MHFGDHRKPGTYHKERFTGPGSTNDNPLPPPTPTRDVIASPEMDERVKKHLQNQDFQKLIHRGTNETSWGFYEGDRIQQIFTDKDSNDTSACDGNSQACLHVHPKDNRFVDPTTGLHNGKIPDDGHRNVFGDKDWRPLYQRGVPNYMIGPEGDLYVLEARNGEYLPRFVAKRFDILRR